MVHCMGCCHVPHSGCHHCCGCRHRQSGRRSKAPFTDLTGGASLNLEGTFEVTKGASGEYEVEGEAEILLDGSATTSGVEERRGLQAAKEGKTLKRKPFSPLRQRRRKAGGGALHDGEEGRRYYGGAGWEGRPFGEYEDLEGRPFGEFGGYGRSGERPVGFEGGGRGGTYPPTRDRDAGMFDDYYYGDPGAISRYPSPPVRGAGPEFYSYGGKPRAAEMAPPAQDYYGLYYPPAMGRYPAQQQRFADRDYRQQRQGTAMDVQGADSAVPIGAVDEAYRNWKGLARMTEDPYRYTVSAHFPRHDFTPYW